MIRERLRRLAMDAPLTRGSRFAARYQERTGEWLRRNAQDRKQRFEDQPIGGRHSDSLNVGGIVSALLQR